MTRQYSFRRLDELREQRGITWYRLGVDIGMLPSTATRANLMRHEPKASKLAAIADVLGVPMDALFEEVPDSASRAKPSTRGKKTVATSKATKQKRRRTS